MSRSYVEYDRRADEIYSLINNGMSREQVANRFNYDNIRSMDQLMRRRGYRVVNNRYVKEEKQKVVCKISARTEKIMDALNKAIKNGEEPTDIEIRRWGFEDRQNLNSYLKEEGVNYDPLNKIYYIVSKEEGNTESLNLQTHVQTSPNLSGVPEKVSDFLPFLRFLYDNKEIFDNMIKDNRELKPHIVNIPGKCIQKTFHINRNLAYLINNFADENSMRYKQVVEAAVVEYLEKYGYFKQIGEIKHRG